MAVVTPSEVRTLGLVADALITFGFRKPPPPPSPMQIASAQLAQAERDQLDAKHEQDAINARCAMLASRVARLKTTIREMAQEEK